MFKRQKQIKKTENLFIWRLHVFSAADWCCGTGGISWRGSYCEPRISGRSGGRVGVAMQFSF